MPEKKLPTVNAAAELADLQLLMENIDLDDFSESTIRSLFADFSEIPEQAAKLLKQTIKLKRFNDQHQGNAKSLIKEVLGKAPLLPIKAKVTATGFIFTISPVDKIAYFRDLQYLLYGGVHTRLNHPELGVVSIQFIDALENLTPVNTVGHETRHAVHKLIGLNRDAAITPSHRFSDPKRIRAENKRRLLAIGESRDTEEVAEAMNQWAEKKLLDEVLAYYATDVGIAKAKFYLPKPIIEFTLLSGYGPSVNARGFKAFSAYVEGKKYGYNLKQIKALWQLLKSPPLLKITSKAGKALKILKDAGHDRKWSTAFLAALHDDWQNWPSHAEDFINKGSTTMDGPL
jgi:hypothetical protein